MIAQLSTGRGGWARAVRGPQRTSRPRAPIALASLAPQRSARPRNTTGLAPHCAASAHAACLDGCTLPCSGAEQHVCAKLAVAAPCSTLWAVLTDFEALPMPNVECTPLATAAPGTIHLQQRVFSQSVFWRVEASARLEVKLQPGVDGGASELEFEMLSGDFETLFGRWIVTPDPDRPHAACTLQYEIVYEPARSDHMPRGLRVFLLKQTLPRNITALAAAAELRSEKDDEIRASRVRAVSLHAADSAAAALAARETEDVQDAQRSSLPWAVNPDAANYAAGWVENRRPIYLGVNNVPIPTPSRPVKPAATGDADDTAARLHDAGNARVAAIHSRLTAAGAVEAATAEAETALSPQTSSQCQEQQPTPGYVPALEGIPAECEVHVRNLDSPGWLHRRLVASIEVAHTDLVQIFGCADDVWRTITDYERLSDVVPAIATSTLVAPPHGHAYPAGMHRLRQLAVKQLPYMQLHTEVVLDVLEREAEGLRRELQFRAHRSDFDILRGKWIVQGQEHGAAHITVLKYAVEMAVKAPPYRALGLVEPLLDRGMVEDVPQSLAAVRRAVEAAGIDGAAEAAPAAAQERVRSLAELRAQLAAEFGGAETPCMPRFATLISRGRSDLARAVARYGGCVAVAGQIGWGPPPAAPRRSQSYWADDANLRAEIDAVIIEGNLPASVVPTHADFDALGHGSVHQAVEKRGGFRAVARLLGYGCARQIDRAGVTEDMSPETGRRMLENAPLEPRALPSVASLLARFSSDGEPGDTAAAEQQAALEREADLLANAMDGLNDSGPQGDWSDVPAWFGEPAAASGGGGGALRLSDAEMARLLADSKESVDAL